MDADVLSRIPGSLKQLQDLTDAFLTQYEFDAFAFCSDDGAVLAAPLAMLMNKSLVDARGEDAIAPNLFVHYIIVDNAERVDEFRNARATLKRKHKAECIGSLLCVFGSESTDAVQLGTQWMDMEEDDYDNEGDSRWRYRRDPVPALPRGVAVFDESVTTREAHVLCGDYSRGSGNCPCPPSSLSVGWGCGDDNCILCVIAARDGRPENETREYCEARERTLLVDDPESMRVCHDYIFNGALDESPYSVCDRVRFNTNHYPCDGAIGDNGNSMGFSCRSDACYLTCMMESINAPHRRLVLPPNPTADNRLITDVAHRIALCRSCWMAIEEMPANQRCCPPAGYGISGIPEDDQRWNSPYSIVCGSDNCLLALTAYHYGRGEESVGR